MERYGWQGKGQSQAEEVQEGKMLQRMMKWAKMQQLMFGKICQHLDILRLGIIYYQKYQSKLLLFIAKAHYPGEILDRGRALLMQAALLPAFTSLIKQDHCPTDNLEEGHLVFYY